MQLIPIAGEILVEVSGIREIRGVYLENTDVDISVECLNDVDDKKIRLSFKANNNKDFSTVSFAIPIIAYRMIIDRLLNGNKVIVVQDSIDDKLSDTKAIKESLQSNGGIWLDGLPEKIISEIVKYRLC